MFILLLPLAIVEHLYFSGHGRLIFLMIRSKIAILLNGIRFLKNRTVEMSPDSSHGSQVVETVFLLSRSPDPPDSSVPTAQPQSLSQPTTSDHLFISSTASNSFADSSSSNSSSDIVDHGQGVQWFHTFSPDLPFPLIVHILYSGLMWSGNLLFWIVALPYTTTFKASIIANTHPILLVLGLLVTGAKVSFGEVVGVLLSFSGILMVSLEDREVRVAEKGPEWVGFLLCFVSASCEVLVIFNRRKTKKYVPLMQVHVYDSFNVCN